MATELRIEGVQVKRRHSLGWLGLSIITLGIYYLVWYYEINRELRDLGADVSPGIAVLALFPGVLLLVPPVMSHYNTATRVEALQARWGVPGRISTGLVLGLELAGLILPFVGLVVPYLLQDGLNRAFDTATSRVPDRS